MTNDEDTSDTTAKSLVDLVANVTGKRYCRSHGGEVDASYGNVVSRNKTKHWICFGCQQKSLAAAKRNGNRCQQK